jgi:hypothetical protein
MKAKFLMGGMVLVSAGIMAQVRVETGGTSVVIGGSSVDVRTKDGKVATNIGNTAIATQGSTAANTVGGMGSGVDIQGVAILNGRVFIDNKEIPPEVTRYKSPRTGEIYVIRRKGGSVEVTSESGAIK